MNNCTCGKEVRLRGFKITVLRKRGVYHYIEHMDGTKPCPDGKWDCLAIKPYKIPTEADKLIKKWNDLTNTAAIVELFCKIYNITEE